MQKKNYETIFVKQIITNCATNQNFVINDFPEILQRLACNKLYIY